MIDIVAYKDSYRQDVISCLRRNYDWMNNYEDLDKWASPLFEYDWINQNLNNEICPYKHGMVIIDDNKVVGYIGLFYSIKRYANNNYLCVNPSTWAIDNEYRNYVFKVFGLVHKSCDVSIDLTPIESMKEMCLKLYKYKYFDYDNYLFIPFPKMKAKEIKLYFIQNENEINDIDIKEKYMDHKQYGVKLTKLCYKEQSTYVFYQIRKEKTRFIKLDWAEILEVSDIELFTKYMRYIIWSIQRKEKAFLKSDSRFFDKEHFKYPIYKKGRVERLVKTDKNIIAGGGISFLYTEVCILNQSASI